MSGQDLQFTFAHNNFNVVDLDKSLAFYKEALGLQELRRREAEAFTLVFLGDGQTGHALELTWLRDWGKPSYNLGDNESTSASASTTMTPPTKSTRKWASFAMRTLAWACISSRTRTATG